jgi:hypothetical protein
MGLEVDKIPPSYGHPPYQGGQGGSSVKRIISLILTSYLIDRRSSGSTYLDFSKQAIIGKISHYAPTY